MPTINTPVAQDSVLRFTTCDECNRNMEHTILVQTGELLETVPHTEARIRARGHYNVMVCISCRAQSFSLCPRCDNYMRYEHINECNLCGDTMCVRCDSTYNHLCAADAEGNQSHPSMFGVTHDERTTAYISTKTHGDILLASRPVGIEIECYARNEMAIQQGLLEGFGIGTDSSLNQNGIEIRTPRLAGKKGEDALRKTCALLAEAEAHVNRTCGLHVHISADDYSNRPNALRTLWLAYLTYEDVLLSFLPRSRRSNRYCINLRNRFHIDEIEEAKTQEAQEKIWYREMNSEKLAKIKAERGSQTRYVGLNLHSFFHAGHAEVRYHSGTISFEKMTQWAALNVRLFDVASHSTSNDILAGRHEIRLTKKTRRFFEAFAIPDTMRAFFLKRQKLFADDRREESATEADITDNSNSAD